MFLQFIMTTDRYVCNGVCISRYTAPDFLYVRSWLPCIFFSGGITMGKIGRQLAVVRYLSSYVSYFYNSHASNLFTTSLWQMILCTEQDICLWLTVIEEYINIYWLMHLRVHIQCSTDTSFKAQHVHCLLTDQC